jgi:hypothetical protein
MNADIPGQNDEVPNKDAELPIFGPPTRSEWFQQQRNLALVEDYCRANAIAVAQRDRELRQANEALLERSRLAAEELRQRRERQAAIDAAHARIEHFHQHLQGRAAQELSHVPDRATIGIYIPLKAYVQEPNIATFTMPKGMPINDETVERELANHIILTKGDQNAAPADRGRWIGGYAIRDGYYFPRVGRAPVHFDIKYTETGAFSSNNEMTLPIIGSKEQLVYLAEHSGLYYVAIKGNGNMLHVYGITAVRAKWYVINHQWGPVRN